MHCIAKSIADDNMNGRTVEELRELLDVPNDWTPEEEERVRKEHAWCEES